MSTLPEAAAALTRALLRAAALHPDHGTRLIVAVRATDLTVLLAAVTPTAPRGPHKAPEPSPSPLTALIPRQEPHRGN